MHSPAHESSPEGELVTCQTKRFRSDTFSYAFQLIKDPAGFHHHHPALGRPFSLSHPGFSRLLGEGFVREHSDPNFSAPLDMPRNRDSPRLNLLGGHLPALRGLETEIPELQGASFEHRLPGHATFLPFSILDFFWAQHGNP